MTEEEILHAAREILATGNKVRIEALVPYAKARRDNICGTDRSTYTLREALIDTKNDFLELLCLYLTERERPDQVPRHIEETEQGLIVPAISPFGNPSAVTYRKDDPLYSFYHGLYRLQESNTDERKRNDETQE